uniref:TSA: Wollemia nobilis Ref_Wollemi_Transcript_9656_2286 transcribed RNA sequence n=1 Tax=Wollemia nobilis TaxID=56998 RepID=A0A0C9S930_9CONI
MEALSTPVFLFQFLSLPSLLIFTISMSWFALYPSDAYPCEPFECGDYVFNYPFGKKQSGCGDPALQLDCDNKQMPLLDINGSQYYILQPHYWPPFEPEDQSDKIKIVDKYLWLHECNLWPMNRSAQFWFTYSSDQFYIAGGYGNITLGTECGKNITALSDKEAIKLECRDDWYYFPYSALAQKYCKSQVQLPVISQIPSDPEKILENGFDIHWNLSEGCADCESKNRSCIYDTHTRAIQCKGKSSNIAVPLGCAFGGVAVAAVVVLLFIYYAKRRKSTSGRGLSGDFGYYQRNDTEAGLAERTIGTVSIFRYDELEQATNFFHEDNELGDGGFGCVFLGKLRDGRTVAVKRLYQENSRRVEQFMNEIQILSSFAHPNLVRLYGCTDPLSPVLLLVYEFIPNGTLADHLHGSRRTPEGLAWEIRLNIAIDTAQALAFLHSVEPPVFHRDVKSTNILLDENFRAKVADFGLSRLVPLNVSHVTTTPQGTPGYVDPEYHQCFQLTDKSDVYSFGVVLVELISAKLAVDVNRIRSEISLANMALDKIRRGALDELVDPDLKSETNHEVKAMVTAVAELAYGCLARERDFRPDMKEVADRLEDIKQLYTSNAKEEQNSLRKESGDLKDGVPPSSPNSVQEVWPSVPSDKGCIISC